MSCPVQFGVKTCNLVGLTCQALEVIKTSLESVSQNVSTKEMTKIPGLSQSEVDTDVYICNSLPESCQQMMDPDSEPAGRG